jgi:hypothetical protein
MPLGSDHDDFARFLRYARALSGGCPFQAATARADVIFDFSGICDLQGCSGMATGVLTLADSYVFGADITAADFISFDYSSSDVNFEITSADAPSLIGGLNADGSINSRDELVVEAAPIIEVFAGVFEAASADREHVDEGTTFPFTVVSRAAPEPPTWAMMLLGFAGLGYAGYRKAKQATVV